MENSKIQNANLKTIPPSTSRENILFWFFLLIFSALNAFLLSKQSYLGLVLPIALAGFWYIIQTVERLFYSILFFTPISIELSKLIGSSTNDISLPTEPLALLLMFWLILLFFLQSKCNCKRAKHPISIAVAFYLGWMLITILTSQMPIISLKFWVAKLWFFIPFFFGSFYVLVDFRKITKFFDLFVLSTFLLLLFVVYRNIFLGMDNSGPALMAVRPFFRDHTSYSALVAMFFPYVMLRLFSQEKRNIRLFYQIIVVSLFLLAIIFSHSRASWLSVLAALGVYLLIKWKLKWYYLTIAAITLFVLAFQFSDQFLYQAKHNKKASAEDLASHVQSITNMNNDDSNLERINRWNSAWLMFKQRPFMGWGPGTYMFQYAPFQMNRDKTDITTNFGNWGNAHSEYLGSMAETGFIGLFSFVIMVALSFFYAVRLYYKQVNKHVKQLIMSVILGLTTYFTHGFLNNYLDLDKAAIPVATMMAIIVILDTQTQSIQHKSGSKKHVQTKKRNCKRQLNSI